MRCTLLVLALALCLMAVASRSPADYGILIAAIVLAVIADFIACKRTELIGWISRDIINKAKLDGGLLSSPPLPPSSSRNNYEVFLSFRGPDTRLRFTDHLYERLIDAGILVFRDDKDLLPGDKVDDALLEYIKQSKISVPIISESYPSSRSCLMELAQILKCQKENNQRIVPIFYHVSPSDLRNQRGCVRDSLRKLKKLVDCKDFDQGKQALLEIAGWNGYHVSDTKNQHEGVLTKRVVSNILALLKNNDLIVPDNLVGIETHVREVMRKLHVTYVNEKATGLSDKDVCVLIICGMPKIGKSTIAKVVYNKIHHLFEGCSCLAIEENGKSNTLTGLQEQLILDLRNQKCGSLGNAHEGSRVMANSIHDKKVLILLDNVHDFGQIKPFFENPSLFGRGSRILVTVARKDVLHSFPIHKNGVADMYDKCEPDTYEVVPLWPYQAFQLFCKLAYRGNPPSDEYKFLSIDIIDIIGGLPWPIHMTASYLYTVGWDIQIWREKLHRLTMKLDKKVREEFQISYVSLDDETKEVFLDIACHFSGMDKRIPSYMWKACGYYPSSNLKHLCDMCLIKIGENNEIWMHSQLRQFGKEIVQSKDPNEPRKGTRLCSHSDALSTLNGEESAEKVEALCLTFDKGQSECIKCERFGNLPHLKFLGLDQATIEGSSQDVLPNLRWLQWPGCSKISELLIFHLESLVILDLSSSLVTVDPQEWGQFLKKAKGLKVLILSGCHLGATPFFHSSSTALEELVIDRTSIQSIHFQQASKLQLKTLSACQCESLVQISDSIYQLKSLVHLRLDGATIDSLPDSLGSLEKLKELLLGTCWKLAELPHSIGDLKLLEVLDLSSTMIAILPSSVKNLENLKVLKMENTLLKEFPREIKSLEKLEEIDLSRCKNLKGPICCDIKGLISLKV